MRSIVTRILTTYNLQVYINHSDTSLLMESVAMSCFLVYLKVCTCIYSNCLFVSYIVITDIDECKVNLHSCNSDKKEVCVNTDGSFRCACKDRYFRNRDECVSGKP